MRLRTRLALALLVAAVVLSATSLVGFSLYRDAVADQERGDLQRTSDGVATQLETLLDEKADVVRLWAQQPELEDHGTIEQRGSLSTFVRQTAFSGASVVAANGTMTGIYAEGLSREMETDLVGRSFRHRRYVCEALDGEMYVSDPVEADSGNRIVTVSTPIYGPSGVLGSFNAAFHLEEGDVVSVAGASATDTRGIRILANGSVVHAAGPTNATDVLVANATVADAGWTVSAVETQSALDARLWPVTLMQVGAFVFVLGSIGVFGIWLYREYVGNFERLHGGFGSLVDGEYGTTVALPGATEWDELEGGFNELSETLARRRTEVTVLNRVLRHNLRNAMTVVVGNADRIAARADDDTVADDARRIRQRGESLLELADHARSVESSLDGPPDAATTRTVGGVFEEVVDGLAEEFPTADVRVQSVPENVAVRGGDLLVVALDELVRNALVHGDDPTVTLVASAVDAEAAIDADEDRVRIAVGDDGPGLPAIERRVLTEPFVETPTEHGRGLGLWLVNWLVDRIDGDIDVTVADGTSVVVTVPRATDEAVDADPIRSAEPAGDD
jgi:signal transduction histidine kinase